MAYERGDRVEITNKEEGFAGSYYIANIISSLSKKEYIIQYRTLLNDDGFAPLREIVTADQIRPLPPEVMTTEFSLLDLVDAYDKDGWWVGKVIRKTGSNYLVYFEDSREEIVYPLSMLRIHQEWDGRVWVSSKK
ncbi:protein AGENET DOMAIN (AGD)-CONTAINING P1 [Lactuca sativa]|uniref:protein AGENET DOMAIN (AGD)-CONTAINING P1 n=1 Tax=Lactuca sativa TaxID=4236 RepID=UPI000CB43B9C|nr:protein AGENET DOMAIN (AGD)-CONTAINING P1 [Lactuca sativa]XP_042753644.1 protein AGENET DOMAIN (AGD)-CONTAINING P1 [Lactuca sativa]